MTALIKTDICVIGAGAGGLSVAAGAAVFGVPVVLVERGAPDGVMGGDCLHHGCVPSKALIAAAHHGHAMRHAGAFGLTAAEPQANLARVHDHIAGVIAAIAPNDTEARYKALGVTVIKGEARFQDGRTIMVGDQAIQARRFVIATGSRPALPDIPGLDAAAPLTTDTFFDLTRRPERLLVLGGGPTGVEIAQSMRRLGCEVTLIEAGRLLPREDAEAAAVLRRTLLAEGVTVLEQATVLRAEQNGARVRLLLDGAQEEGVSGTHLLVATGRRPNIEGLDLAVAGITVDDGGIRVNRSLRTSNSRVFAIGDCVAGGPRQTHAASHQAGLVIRSALFRLSSAFDTDLVPRVVFCDPEIATVGLAEDQARAKGHDIRILRWPFSENDRARTERRTAGLVKLVVTRKGRILGIMIAGPHAGELIAPWCLALQKGLHVKDMAGAMLPYPTYGEAARRAAMSFYTPMVRRPGLRRLIRLLRIFG